MPLKPFQAPGNMLFSRPLWPWGRRGGNDGDWEVVLDISRLLGRAYHSTPTGVDRVEMAYARELLDRMPDRLHFAAVHPAGGFYGRLPLAAVRQFLAFTLARWQSVERERSEVVRRAAIRHLLALRPRAVPAPTRQRIYLQASPHHLERQELVASILQAEQAKLVTLVHDVIPITYPEYARPDGAAEHRRRVATLGSLSAGIIGNSRATLDAVCPLLPPREQRPLMTVAHLGREEEVASWPVDRPAEHAELDPYFICVSTIEPRKNHILLLNLWRRLVEVYGTGAPKLVLVGRRGWENENVVDLLDRCEAIRGHVIEKGDASDREMHALLRGARAMLLPSFAEGYGMPVIEAMSAGVPVICSDIPALREVGGDVPDYLDPIDGIGWLQRITEYAVAESPRRAAQLERLKRWSPCTWSQHFDIVTRLIDQVVAQG